LRIVVGATSGVNHLHGHAATKSTAD